MQYLLMIYDEDKVWEKMPEAERNAVYAEYGAYTTALQEAGALVGANQLQPTSTATTVSIRDGEQLQDADTATTVRVRNGETLTTDGPFAETKEQLGGFYLVDAPDLDAAIAMAAKIPAARFGSIEVRPIEQLTK